MQVGESVPDFSLPATGGAFRLAEAIRDKKAVVLYFYPKDDTPGCTLESGEFSRLHDEFQKHNAVVLGVSPDDIPSHHRFRDKFNYRHHLLSDGETQLCQQFRVLRENAENNRPAGSVVRSTFLIDRDGKLTREWRDIHPKGHAENVLDAVRQLPTHPA